MRSMKKGSKWYYVYRSRLTGQYVDQWTGLICPRNTKRERRLRYP